MLRMRAIRELLIEDVAGIPVGHAGDEADEPSELYLQLERAVRRAGLVIALSWAALVLLLATRRAEGPWLALGPGEETIFAIGVLVVAVYSGFRLGQRDKLRAVQRVLKRLDRYQATD